jgi:MFS family permease
MQFYVLRALLGAAEAGFFPGILLYLTYWVPAARRGRVTSLFMFAVPISGVIGGPLSASIMAGFDGWLGYAGWQWMFLIEGIPSSLLGIAAFYYLTDSPRTAAWLTDAEKALVSRELERDQQRKTGRSHHAMGPALRDPRIYLLSGMAFALFASIGGVFFWLPTVLRNAGVASLWQIGLLSAIPFGVGAVAQFLNGRDSDRRMERRWHTAVPALIAAVGWAALPTVATQPALAVTMLTLASAGTLAAMVPFWTMPAALLSGTAAAAGIALITSAGSTGNFISPIVVGWVASATGSLAAGQYYLAGLMLIGATAMLLMRLRETPDAAPRASMAVQET